MNKRKLPVCVLLAAMLAAQTSCEIEGGIIGYLTGRMPETDEGAPEEAVYSEPVPANLSADYDWAVSNAPDFTVSNAEELISAAYWVNHICEDTQRATITVAQDIDLSGFLWEPIGYGQGKSFYGEIDGGGHTISGLTIRNSQFDTGFVGNAASLVVHDITFSEADISGGPNIGIVCGEKYGSETWENITVSGKIKTDSSVDYGAIGGRTPDLKFVGCSADVTVNGEEFNYFSWQEYADTHNVHEDDYTIEFDGNGSIRRSIKDKEAENLGWRISRNGESVLGRGCEDEYTIDPQSFDIVGGDPGLYAVHLEAFYGNGYLRCSNILEYEIVPSQWPEYCEDRYPLCTSDPYEIAADPDRPNRISSTDGYTPSEKLGDLFWVYLADGMEAGRAPFAEGEYLNTGKMMIAAKDNGFDFESGEHTTYTFVAGEAEDGTVKRVSNIYEERINYSDPFNDGDTLPTVYVDGIDTDGDLDEYTASLAADDLDNEEEFLRGMIIVGPEGHAWRAEPARTGGKYSYGDREGDTSAFHIVTDQSGHMFCIDKDPSYESGHNVKWVMLFDGNEELTADYFDDPAAVQQGAFVPFKATAPKEGVYSVYVIDDVSGTKERISNVLEFRIV
ncbi:MAG: hypothetical protein J5501_02845 [Ruminococcus sp.]|nr:hypothetical protein [Ruminococcus sp.]